VAWLVVRHTFEAWTNSICTPTTMAPQSVSWSLQYLGLDT
jgi:hypothetical protein